MPQNCPVCETALIKSERQLDGTYFECSRCGSYMFEDETVALLPQAIRAQKHARAILSHSIRKVARPGSWPTISPILLGAIADGKVRLPNPSEQMDNLIVWLAATQADAGATVEDVPQGISVVGATSTSITMSRKRQPLPRRSLNATIIPRCSPAASTWESCSTALDSGRTPTTDPRRLLEPISKSRNIYKTSKIHACYA
jgi:hypothetical protein